MMIPEEFLASEVREGYYIPAKMKRCWASILEVLNEISVICNRHHLKWWMDWGTMLGVVRHGGFIPWDDDVDISMLRGDYMQFLRYAKEELPEGYKIANVYNDYDFQDSLTRLVSSGEVRLNESFLNKNHGMPYVIGVDIMVIDYVPRDQARCQEICELVSKLHYVAGSIEPERTYKEVPFFHKDIEALEKRLRHTFSKTKPLSQQLAIMEQELMGSVKEEEADYATMMGAYATRPDFKTLFPKQYYNEIIMLPFEFIEIPVPLHYNEMLSKVFGNYMTPFRGGGTHDYPMYAKQEEIVMNEVGGIAWPLYQYGAPSGAVQKNEEGR